MNSLGLAIFAVIAVVCLSTSSALPSGMDLQHKQGLADLLNQLQNTYQTAIKRNFCDNPFLDSLASDFCMRKKRSGVVPQDIAEYIARNRREAAVDETPFVADQE